MALSDFQIFNEWVYGSATEVIAQQIDLFNGASGGVLLLKPSAHAGDFTDRTLFGLVSGIVRRRDPSSNSTVAGKQIQDKLDTMVKVAAGTPPLNLSVSELDWMQRDPQAAGMAYGRQIAVAMMADMLNTTVGSLDAALQAGSLTYDISGMTFTTGEPATSPTMNPSQLAVGAGKFGDQMSQIGAFVMHSKVLTDIFVNALTNNERLFNYGNVNIMRDPAGRLYVVSDIPALFVAGTPNKYHTLALTPAAAECDQNDDYRQETLPVIGTENINYSTQAQWSYNIGIKGFSWNKTSGGPHPNDAALFTSSNWTKYATDDKNTAGVLIISK